MSDLFGMLARIYPVLVVLGALVLIAGVLGAWSRMSAGSVGAGPAAIDPPPTAGLEVVPWPAQMIEDALATDPDSIVGRLVRRGAEAGIEVVVPVDQTAWARLDAALAQLEAALQIGSHRDDSGTDRRGAP